MTNENENENNKQEYVMIISIDKSNKVDLLKIDKMLKALDSEYELKMFEKRKPFKHLKE